MQEVALYDPNRKPAGWMEIIQTTQYAVFLSDVESGTPLTSVGHPLTAGSNASCLIFDSLEEAEKYCRQKVDGLAKMRCDVFDSEGRAHPPVATFVNPRYAGRMDSDAKAGRMMRCSLVVMTSVSPTLGTPGKLAAKRGSLLFLESNSSCSVCGFYTGTTE